MSLFSWLSRTRQVQADSSGLSRIDSTRPVARRHSGREAEGGNAQPANRKNERMARRELLYAVVRESMMRAGVLSASYKFKVLSLDARGRQFLVMVDLAPDNAGETVRLAEIEALIAQGAKSRHDIIVNAVYWRSNEHVAIGDPGPRPDAYWLDIGQHEDYEKAMEEFERMRPRLLPDESVGACEREATPWA